MFQILGRRADSLRIGHYTNFLDTTDQYLPLALVAQQMARLVG